MDTKTARVDALRARLRMHGAKLTSTPGSPVGGFYIRRPDGSLLTHNGFPITLADAEHYLEVLEREGVNHAAS